MEGFEQQWSGQYLSKVILPFMRVTLTCDTYLSMFSLSQETYSLMAVIIHVKVNYAYIILNNQEKSHDTFEQKGLWM